MGFFLWFILLLIFYPSLKALDVPDISLINQHYFFNSNILTFLFNFSDFSTELINTFPITNDEDYFFFGGRQDVDYIEFVNKAIFILAEYMFSIKDENWSYGGKRPPYSEGNVLESGEYSFKHLLYEYINIHKFNFISHQPSN